MSCKREISVYSLALLVFTIFMIGFIPGEVCGQAKVGTAGFKSLDIGISARAMGMGEAYSAIANDVSAMYYNPAGLTQMFSREVMATHIDYPVGITFNFVGVAFPVEALSGVIGFGYYGMNSGDILYADHAYVVGNGQFFQANESAYAVTYARNLTEHFSLGTTFKILLQQYDTKSATGWSADVGTLYDTGYRGFKIAMSIVNFGPDMTMIDDPYPLPISFKFGSSFNIIESPDHLAVFALEGAHPSDNLEQYNAGLEYWFLEKFSLRIGNRFNYDTDGITFGGGLKWPYSEAGEIRVDYSFQDMHILREFHRFSFTLAF